MGNDVYHPRSRVGEGLRRAILEYAGVSGLGRSMVILGGNNAIWRYDVSRGYDERALPMAKMLASAGMEVQNGARELSAIPESLQHDAIGHYSHEASPYIIAACVSWPQQMGAHRSRL